MPFMENRNAPAALGEIARLLSSQGRQGYIVGGFIRASSVASSAIGYWGERQMT